MPASNGVKIVFGAASLAGQSVDEVSDWLKTLDELDIKTIDTATIYGDSEDLLGKAGAAARFTVDTKAPGAWGLVSTKDNIIATGKSSLEKLATDQVDIYYLHSPDHRVPWEETLSGLDALYKQGAFKRLGLSNFSAADVDAVIRTAKEHNYVLPTVYQGNYSAVARRTESEIFPTLRRHGLAFYAYSPIAGGFLTKSAATLAADSEGRFGADTPIAKIYHGMYNRPGFLAALGTWEEIARDEGVSKAELAYRWIVYHSALKSELGDAVIVGARTQEQLRETARGIEKGPLSEAAAKRIEGIWEVVKDEAELDNYQHLVKANAESVDSAEK